MTETVQTTLEIRFSGEGDLIKRKRAEKRRAYVPALKPGDVLYTNWGSGARGTIEVGLQ